MTHFFEFYNDIVRKLTSEHRNIYITGDFNIDLFKTDNHVNEFLSINSLFGILPVIHTATRITINSATLIDNIFTNVIDSNAHCGTFCTDITDHLPIFMILKSTNSLRILENTRQTFFKTRASI